MAQRWVIAGGGTGGHVTPALALGEALRARGAEVLFVGSSRGLESKLVPAAGFELEVLFFRFISAIEELNLLSIVRLYGLSMGTCVGISSGRKSLFFFGHCMFEQKKRMLRPTIF